MICPQCENSDTAVIESRKNGARVIRRRKCLACSFRFTTHEQVPGVGWDMPRVVAETLAELRRSLDSHTVRVQHLEAEVVRFNDNIGVEL